MRTLKLLLALSFLLMLGCEDHESPPPIRVIPELVKPIVERFEMEAERRGHQVDLSKLSIEFVKDITSDTNPGLVVASCRRAEDLHLIEIDTASIFWKFAGAMGQEEVVFHELGHCALERSHIEDVLPNGAFKSIMRAQGSPNYGNFNPLSQNALIHRRDYYLDELFNPNAGVPCWSDNSVESPFPLTVFEQESIKQDIQLHIDGDDDLFYINQQQLFLIRDDQVQQIDLGLTVTTLRVDQQGVLWLAARNDDIGVVGTYVNDTFTMIYEDDQGEGQGLLYNLSEFYIDTDQKLWLGTLTGKLYIEQESGAFLEFTQFPNSFIGRLQTGPNNTILAIKGFDLLIFEDRVQPPEVLVFSESGLPGGFVSEFAVDQNEDLWLIIQGFQRGVSLARLNLSTTNAEVFDPLTINIPDTFAQSLTVDNTGALWLATSNGLRRWDGERFSNYCQYNTQSPILSISQVAIDENGTVWSLGLTPDELEPRLVRQEVGF